MVRVIKTFSDDNKYGGFGKRYLDPLVNEEDAKFLNLYLSMVDEGFIDPDSSSEDVLIYSDILEKYKEKMNLSNDK